MFFQNHLKKKTIIQCDDLMMGSYLCGSTEAGETKLVCSMIQVNSKL